MAAAARDWPRPANEQLSSRILFMGPFRAGAQFVWYRTADTMTDHCMSLAVLGGQKKCVAVGPSGLGSLQVIPPYSSEWFPETQRCFTYLKHRCVPGNEIQIVNHLAKKSLSASTYIKTHNNKKVKHIHKDDAHA